jgi:hypothetical protein
MAPAQRLYGCKALSAGFKRSIDMCEDLEKIYNELLAEYQKTVMKKMEEKKRNTIKGLSFLL